MYKVSNPRKLPWLTFSNVAKAAASGLVIGVIAIMFATIFGGVFGLLLIANVLGFIGFALVSFALFVGAIWILGDIWNNS